jgi:hypothetical protein
MTASGGPCTFCGGTRMTPVSGPTAGPHHPAIMTVVITFCLGLAGLRAIAGFIAPHWMPATPGYGDLLSNLQLIILAATVLYLILRRSEGDFRALLAVALGLFLTAEGLGVAARGYGFLLLNDAGKPFNLALFAISSLALTAGLADGFRRGPYHTTLMGASVGLLFLATLRVGLEMKQRDLTDKAQDLLTIVLAAVAVCVAVLLVRAEIIARRPLPAPPAPPDAPPDDPRLDPEASGPPPPAA